MKFDGFIFLYRQLLESRVFQNEGLLKVWIWCLLKAGHKERWVPVRTGRGETEVHLEPGQFIFGRKSAAKQLCMRLTTVSDRMQKLKKLGNIDTQPGSHFTIITIVNWGFYQKTTNKNGTQPGTHPTTNRHPSDINNNDNTIKNVKKKNTKKKEFTPPTINETIQFFVENGFSESAGRKAHAYYQDGNWNDSRGNPVKNWKQKMRGVWFKDENRTINDKHNNFREREYVGTPDDEICWLQD